MAEKPTYQEQEQKVKALEEELDRRKQAEWEMRKSDENLRTIFENANDLIIYTDMQGTIIDSNQRITDIFGYDREEVIGRKFTEFKIAPPEEMQKLIAQYSEVLSGSFSSMAELTCIRKDGTEVFIEVNTFIVQRDGKIKNILSIIRDITGRKQAAEALRKSEEKFRNIFENLKDVYFETTLDGIIKNTTPSAESFSGYSMTELIGNRVDMLYHNPKDREGFLAELRKRGKVRGYELLFKKKQGETYDVSFNADLSLDADGKPEGITGTIRDITQQKKLEAQLLQAKKMEALGLLAGGVAHDLNNILSGIVSYPELMLLDLPEKSNLRDPLETIRESGIRASDVVSDLLTVARGVASSRELSSLNKIVNEYMLSAGHKNLDIRYPYVTVSTRLDPELLNVNCSSIHLMKALINLVINACEAISDRGTVVICTSNRYIDTPLKGYDDVRRGEYAVLTVSDNGPGISSADLERIFEPFYTKKVMGRSGTGLGLTVVWNTVEEHRGYIDVKSGAEGTEFDLYFPATREKVKGEPEQVELEDCFGNGERILVIDDEVSQRKIASGLLTKLGYSVDAVSSGEEAVEYLSKRSVDLIILDMIMYPGMHGGETYKKILKIHPNQKAIIASGFSETAEVREAQRSGAGKYIKKPYTLQKIGRAVKEELQK